MSNPIVVKILQLNCAAESIAVEYGFSVSTVFSNAGKTFNQGEVTRRHTVVYPEDQVYDGDVLMISKKTKGNQDYFEVEILRMGGGGVISHTVEPGYTIKQVLDGLSPSDKAQFFRADGTPAYEFRIAGGASNQAVSIDTTIPTPTNGTGKVRLICSQVVKGNE